MTHAQQMELDANELVTQGEWLDIEPDTPAAVEGQTYGDMLRVLDEDERAQNKTAHPRKRRKTERQQRAAKKAPAQSGPLHAARPLPKGREGVVVWENTRAPARGSRPSKRQTLAVVDDRGHHTLMPPGIGAVVNTSGKVMGYWNYSEALPSEFLSDKQLFMLQGLPDLTGRRPRGAKEVSADNVAVFDFQKHEGMADDETIADYTKRTTRKGYKKGKIPAVPKGVDGPAHSAASIELPVKSTYTRLERYIGDQPYPVRVRTQGLGDQRFRTNKAIRVASAQEYPESSRARSFVAADFPYSSAGDIPVAQQGFVRGAAKEAGKRPKRRTTKTEATPVVQKKPPGCCKRHAGAAVGLHYTK